MTKNELDVVAHTKTVIDAAIWEALAKRYEKALRCLRRNMAVGDWRIPIIDEALEVARAKSGQNQVQKAVRSKNSTKSSRPLSSDG